MSENIQLQSTVMYDDIVKKVSSAFDYDFDGTVTTTISVPDFPTDFSIGLIVGSSGSGKSTLLKRFGAEQTVHWQNGVSIASHFPTFEEASQRFGAVGLNSIPTWLKPYPALSTGERFRADLSRQLESGAVIDEFTSVVNRECAKSCSMSIAKYIRASGMKNVVFASCHDDIIPFLEPDWVYNTDKQELSVGRSLRQPKGIVLEIRQCSNQVWGMFAKYHYLTAEINASADCYLVTWDKLPVAFGSVLVMPGRFGDGSDTRKCVSLHRLVVLPDYQGMGIGNKLSEYLASLYASQGYRYFIKTANPRMGEHMGRHSDLWRPTWYNQRARTKRSTLDTITDADIRSVRGSMGRCSSTRAIQRSLVRICYAYEYIGEPQYEFTSLITNQHRTLF